MRAYMVPHFSRCWSLTPLSSHPSLFSFFSLSLLLSLIIPHPIHTKSCRFHLKNITRMLTNSDHCYHADPIGRWCCLGQVHSFICSRSFSTFYPIQGTSHRPNHNPQVLMTLLPALSCSIPGLPVAHTTPQAGFLPGPLCLNPSSSNNCMFNSSL